MNSIEELGLELPDVIRARDTKIASDRYAESFNQGKEMGIPEETIQSQIQICASVFEEAWTIGAGRVLEDMAKMEKYRLRHKRSLLRWYGVIAWGLLLASFGAHAWRPDLVQFADAALLVLLICLSLLFTSDVERT